MKPFYEDPVCRLYHGNSENVLPLLPAESADMVLTSPPYDNLRTYGGFTFNFPPIADELVRILKPGGVIVWIVGDQTADYTESGTSFRQALGFVDRGLKLFDTMIFEKHNFSNPEVCRYHQIFEYMFVLSKGKPKTFNPIKDKENKYKEAWGRNTRRMASGELKEKKRNVYTEWGMRTNIWKYLVGNVTGDDKIALEHPAIFPEALARDHIVSWSNPGDTVVDCFAGSGTTQKMAKLLNRRSIGIEQSADFCKIAVTRIQQQTLGL